MVDGNEEVTISITLTREEWCEVVNACGSKANLIRNGDYGEVLEDECECGTPANCTCNQLWAETLESAGRKMTDACTKVGVAV